eukprot:1671735-Rhodomonas_salina.3
MLLQLRSRDLREEQRGSVEAKSVTPRLPSAFWARSRRCNAGSASMNSQNSAAPCAFMRFFPRSRCVNVVHCASNGPNSLKHP